MYPNISIVVKSFIEMDRLPTMRSGQTVTSEVSVRRLPCLDGVYRIDQHHDIEKQAVVNPQE